MEGSLAVHSTDREFDFGHDSKFCCNSVSEKGPIARHVTCRHQRGEDFRHERDSSRISLGSGLLAFEFGNPLLNFGIGIAPMEMAAPRIGGKIAAVLEGDD